LVEADVLDDNSLLGLFSGGDLDVDILSGGFNNLSLFWEGRLIGSSRVSCGGRGGPAGLLNYRNNLFIAVGGGKWRDYGDPVDSWDEGKEVVDWGRHGDSVRSDVVVT